MLFTDQEIKKLLEIVDYHSSFTAGSTLGKESLSDYDKFILNKHGIDSEKIRDGKETPYYHMYMWGKLSSELSNSQSGQVTFKDFEKYIKRGQYVPLTKTEERQLNVAKQKSYSHIKGLGDRMKQTVNGIIIEQDQKRRSEYEKVIKDELKRGVVDRKAVTSIVSEIGEKTKDWNRDWGRIVETEFNNIFQQGRSEKIREDKGGEANVFKEVYPLACKHCIRLLLTNGIGSQPIVFKLDDLISNGSNYGKKTADWEATVDGLHPYCRCNLTYLPDGYVWSEEKKRFTMQENKERKYQRKSKVKVTVGDKTFMA